MTESSTEVNDLTSPPQMEDSKSPTDDSSSETTLVGIQEDQQAGTDLRNDKKITEMVDFLKNNSSTETLAEELNMTNSLQHEEEGACNGGGGEIGQIPKDFFLAIDQGTSSTRVISFDRKGKERYKKQIKIGYVKGIVDHYVEQDPYVYLETAIRCLNEVLEQMKEDGVDPSLIAGIGITNQRETIIPMDITTGRAVGNAIVWSDTRAADIAESLAKHSRSKEIMDRTGLRFDAYFSALKAKWLVENDNQVRELYFAGKLACCTVDTWLLYNLTGGSGKGIFATDKTNAQRTMLYDKTFPWEDGCFLEFFGLEKLNLPKVCSSSEEFGTIKVSNLKNYNIKITGLIGDQSSALVGHLGFKKGSIKVTYGTGCFVMCCTGEDPVASKRGLLTSVLLDRKDHEPMYALEGSVQTCGKIIPWLKTQGYLPGEEKIEKEFNELLGSWDNGGIVFISALGGIKAPHWIPGAKAISTGLTYDGTSGNFVRAVGESITHQVEDNIEAIKGDTGVGIVSLNVDGGLAKSGELMQIQSDISQLTVRIPEMTEPTAFGAAVVGGLATGFWTSLEHLEDQITKGKMNVDIVNPEWSAGLQDYERRMYKSTMELTKMWVENNKMIEDSFLERVRGEKENIRRVNEEKRASSKEEEESEGDGQQRDDEI